MTIQIHECNGVRTIFDDYNPRIFQEEYRCVGCSGWFSKEETQWHVGWEGSKTHCQDCYPEEVESNEY